MKRINRRGWWNPMLPVMLLTFTTSPVYSHHHIHIRERCSGYREYEEYIPPHYDQNGIYHQGRIKQSLQEIGCNTISTPHLQYHHNIPSHANSMANINATPRTPSSHSNSKCDGLSRMGIGGLAGAAGGYALWGGNKSRNSNRNITLSTLAGTIAGRILPC